MSARVLAGVLVGLSGAALATPSGNSWPLVSCTNSCTVQTTGQASGNMACVSTRCLPEVRFAASVGNAGTMVLNGSQGVPYTTALAGMRSGFERWTSSNVTTCGTALNFAFAAMPFSSPTQIAAANGSDGNNNVIFLGGSNWRYGSGTLGLTSTRFFPQGGELTDADMEMNNNTPWANDGRGNSWDYESVIAHEAGHFIGFDHTNSGNAVMNPTIGNGLIKRALLSPDQSDVCTVYPGQAGGQGAPCSTPATCTGGRVCEGPATDAGASVTICTQNCTAVGQTCPSGTTCQPSNNGFACLPPQVTAADICRFCTAGSDCSTGVCIGYTDGTAFCTTSCNPTVSNSCPNGYSCRANGGSAFCEPTTDCTNQCTPATAAADCAPGYGCVNGLCTPTGNPGDRCEFAGVCDNCGLCILDDADPNIAFCRSCCNGTGSCQGCGTAACQPVSGQATVCTPLGGDTARICFPTTGATLCQACDTANPCVAGLSCFAGVCRSSCNPSNPGTCPACQPSGSAGVCACTTQEVVDEGQPCSPTVPARFCRTGNRCAAGTCRTSCNPAAPVPCGTGFVCQNVGGNNVCVPGGGTGGGSAGGGTAGGSTAGGSAGGGTAGGSTAGGSTAGGSTAGGSTAGGSTAGGATAGGATAGGATAGGSTAGGSTAGGSSAGGRGGGTAGGTPQAGGSTAGGSSAGGTAQAGGTALAGGTAGGAAVGGGSAQAGGASGGAGGGPTMCGPGNCLGCCANGVCVSFTSAERCGTSGAECRACASTQTCSAAGQCVATPPTGGCGGCSAGGLGPLGLLVLGLLARRRTSTSG